MSSPFQKMFTTKTPLKQGGYEGGGDIAGAQYVPTGSMYANMFAKIGQAVSDIGAAKQKKKDATGLSDDAYFKKYGEIRPKLVDYKSEFSSRLED